MAWITLTKKHIKDRLASDELDAIEGTGGGDGDRLTGIIAQVVALIRSKVAACHKNELGDAGMIPEECLYAAATIVKHDIRASLPSIVDDTELRRDEYRNAYQFLNKVATCEIGIDAPIGATPPSDPSTGCYGGEPLHNF